MLNQRVEISDTAYMDTYILDDLDNTRKRKSVIICPGGGYEFCSPSEADPVAARLNAAGFNAFVLWYTTPPPTCTQPLKELSDAVCTVRRNADKWCADAEKITVMGFSAGGHLAASLGAFWDKPELGANGMNKPNALVLAYPVISAEPEIRHDGTFKALLGGDFSEENASRYSLEKFVNRKTPQTFIWHTQEDDGVPVENSMLFVTELQKNRIPFEMHIFPYGEHGLSLGTKELYPNADDHHSSIWMDLCIRWMEACLLD